MGKIHLREKSPRKEGHGELLSLSREKEAQFTSWTLCNKSVNTRTSPTCPFTPLLTGYCPLLSLPGASSSNPTHLLTSPSNPKHTPWLPAGFLCKLFQQNRKQEIVLQEWPPRSPTSLVSGKMVMAEWALGWPNLSPSHQYMLQMWLQSLEHLFSSC